MFLCRWIITIIILAKSHIEHASLLTIVLQFRVTTIFIKSNLFLFTVTLQLYCPQKLTRYLIWLFRLPTSLFIKLYLFVIMWCVNTDLGGVWRTLAMLCCWWLVLWNTWDQNTMTSFTEGGLNKRLKDLNSSQQSIQTLSLWLIHHRKYAHTVVKIWAKEISTGKFVKIECRSTYRSLLEFLFNSFLS